MQIDYILTSKSKLSKKCTYYGRLTNQFSLKNVCWMLYILTPSPLPPMKNVQRQNAGKSMKNT